MKKFLALFLPLVILLLASCGSSDEPYSIADEKTIVHESGKEYVFVAMEGTGKLKCIGDIEFDGYVNGQDRFVNHMTGTTPSGMYSMMLDPERRMMIYYAPDNEFYYFYRDASLPPLNISLEGCSRFELRLGLIPGEDVEHLLCDEGIADAAERAVFIDEIMNGPTASEVGFIRERDPWREVGIAYGYLAGETNLVIPLRITEYIDKGYTIEVLGREYLMAAKWLDALQRQN